MDDSQPGRDDHDPRDLLAPPADLTRETTRLLKLHTQATASSPLQVRHHAIRGHPVPAIWPPVPPELN